MKYYICGPMTGLPQFNIPLFDEVAAKLRGEGLDVVSPAELDDASTRATALASPDGAPGSGSANGETWGDFLARDVKLIADSLDAIVVLPDWHKSRGARLEVFVGLLTGKSFYAYRPLGRGPGEYLLAFPRDHIRAVMQDNMP